MTHLDVRNCVVFGLSAYSTLCKQVEEHVPRKMAPLSYTGWVAFTFSIGTHYAYRKERLESAEEILCTSQL